MHLCRNYYDLISNFYGWIDYYYHWISNFYGWNDYYYDLMSYFNH